MKVSIAIVTLTLTMGCSIKYVPYDSGAPWRGGYSEHKLAQDIYEVRYEPGGGFSPLGEPQAGHYHEDFRLLRCAELTLESGHQYFLVEGGITPQHYFRPDTYVIKMFVVKPNVDPLVFVYHAETVQKEMRTSYEITPY